MMKDQIKMDMNTYQAWIVYYFTWSFSLTYSKKLQFFSNPS